MKMKIKNIALIVLLVTLCSLSSYLAGVAVSRRSTTEALLSKMQGTFAFNDVYYYSKVSEILFASKKSNLAVVTCLGEKMVSELALAIRSCAKDADCRKTIEQNATLLAPELLAEPESGIEKLNFRPAECK